jgi:hypothetical protein
MLKTRGGPMGRSNATLATYRSALARRVNVPCSLCEGLVFLLAVLNKQAQGRRMVLLVQSMNTISCGRVVALVVA